MSTYNVKSEVDLTSLNNHLKTNPFVGGVQPNAQDALTFEQFECCPCGSKTPAILGWFLLMNYFTSDVRDSWKVVAEKKQTTKKEVKKVEVKKEEEGSDDDMFGDTEETPKEKEKRELKEKEAKEKKEAEKAKAEGTKKKVVGKSLVLLDVKVWEMETDFDALAKKIFTEIKYDGLVWKEQYKTPVIAFGMKKLVIGCVCEDEKVSVDEHIIDVLLLWEDEIQSIDIASFDKI
jgi:elongation factor 1-beta